MNQVTPSLTGEAPMTGWDMNRGEQTAENLSRSCAQRLRQAVGSAKGTWLHSEEFMEHRTRGGGSYVLDLGESLELAV